jgi:hypothetical protein
LLFKQRALLAGTPWGVQLTMQSVKAARLAASGFSPLLKKYSMFLK